MTKLMRFVNDDSGTTAIEYGLIAAAIGLMLILVLPAIRTQLQRVFTSISTGLATF